MDIATLKEKLGDDYDKLAAHVEALAEQRDVARRESIEGRKALKSRVTELESQQKAMLEKLGLESVEEINDLPDSKGQAEAVKQFEARLKRMERELSDKDGAIQAVTAKHREALLDADMEKALSGMDWLDRDIAAMLVRNGTTWEGDEVLFKAGDKLVNLADGVKHLAASKPHLLKSQGSGGSGFRQGAASGGASNPWSKEHWNITQQIQLESSDSQAAARFKADAGMVSDKSETITIV